VNFPPALLGVLSFLSFVNLNFIDIAPTGCAVEDRFSTRLIFTTLTPLLCAALVLIHLRYKTWQMKKYSNNLDAMSAVWSQHIFMLLFGSNLVYPGVCASIFQTFSCEHFEGGFSALKADYSMDCDSEAYTQLRIYASFMVLLYPIGLPAIYFAILFQHRADILSKPEEVQHLGFLFREYKPSLWFFEVYELFRKTTLSGLIIFFAPGTATQLVVAMLICLLAIFVLSVHRPYVNEDSNRFAVFVNWQMYFVLFTALLIKTDVTTDDAYSQNAFSALTVLIALASAAIGFIWGFYQWPYLKWRAIKAHHPDMRTLSAEMVREIVVGGVGLAVTKGQRPTVTNSTDNEDNSTSTINPAFVRTEKASEPPAVV
jgi:hypothetical protein